MLFAGTPGGVYRIPEQPFEQADQVLDGVSVRAILRGPAPWDELGRVPISDANTRAWDVRSLAVIDE